MLTRSDEGALSLLIIGYAAIAALLIVVGVDASKVFLAQRALASAADAAALAAAQEIDRSAVYSGRTSCVGLPLDAGAATAAADRSVGDSADTLSRTFTTMSAPDVRVDGATVRVRLQGDVSVPFGRVLALLVPGHPDGRVSVSADAAAASAPATPSC